MNTKVGRRWTTASGIHCVFAQSQPLRLRRIASSVPVGQLACERDRSALASELAYCLQEAWLDENAAAGELNGFVAVV